MYTVIIPIYNEEQVLPELRTRLMAATAGVDEPFEVILIDDGSHDTSYTLMTAMHMKDPRIKVIRLSRNFGHQIAISAGLDEARGDAVVLMDGDLQDPPEVLPEMIRLWKEGFHVVYTVKRSRRENPLKRLAFRSFYRILHALSTIQILALDGIFSFSNVPLRLAVYFGLIAAATSFAGGFYVIYAKLFTNQAILGWASTILSILFVGGMILVTLGVIGEYISRIYEEVKKRPLYVIRDKIGF
jgi:glycosyltransferase involved in cell wall biosynthesis